MRVMVHGKMLSGEDALRHLLTQERHRAERAESDARFWACATCLLVFAIGFVSMGVL